MKLSKPCPICSRPLELVSSIELIGDNKLNTFKCGHVFSSTVIHIDNKDELNLKSVDGSKEARPYQSEGVEFIIQSDFNCIIADQMRLGKTPQSLLALKNAYKERTPCLILVRSANLWQWIREYKIWVDTLPNGIFPIVGTKGMIFPGFSAYIMSMDTFSRQVPCVCGHLHDERCKKCEKNGTSCRNYTPDPKQDSMTQKLLNFGFKLVIVDEAHSFKNTSSNRSQALVDFIGKFNNDDCQCGHKRREHSWDLEKKICVMGQCACDNYKPHSNGKVGIIMLTGTPIKNRADEYFVPLNLVAPEVFPSLARFQQEWLQQDEKGKYSRVHPYRMDSFKRLIKPYVLRREKEDVFKELPKINRIFTVIEPDKDALISSYNKILDNLEMKLSEKVNPSYWDMADELTTLRRICGLMKVPFVSDYLETSLMDTNTEERYAVGIHHKDVRDILYYKLGSEKNCFKLSGEDSAEQKDWIMRNFETSPQRVCIINMLAGGVGLDFHYCNNVLILERQWSSSDEEQFEFRFYNPDLKIKKASTTCEYIIIKGSIEQFFFDMVETKRQIFGETIGTNWSLTSEPSSFKELVEQTVASRL